MLSQLSSKVLAVLGMSVILLGGVYVYYSSSGDNSEIGMLCHVDKPAGMVDKVLAMVSFAQEQEPQQQEPPESHSLSAGNGCSRPSKDAEPGTELNGVDPQTVGCKCVKQCLNGYTQEDLSRDEKGKFICKNACHKDRCTCPDPCKH